MFLSSLAPTSACIDAHSAFVGRATAGRAAVGADLPPGKTAGRTATAALLAAVCCWQ